MNRLDLLPADPDDPQLRAMFEDVLSRWPRIPNLYRTLGHSPEMLQGWLDLAWTLRLKAKTPRRLRELIILEGARASRTAYEWAHHVPMALDAGISQAEIDALSRGEFPASLSEAERAALTMAREVTLGEAASPDSIEALKRFFSAAEVVELVLTATFYVCVSRTIKSLGVPLEDGFETPDFTA